jgi:hypothetical protein
VFSRKICEALIKLSCIKECTEINTRISLLSLIINEISLCPLWLIALFELMNFYMPRQKQEVESMSSSNADEDEKSYEYINEFLFFVIKPDKTRGGGAYIYCSGVDLFRFLPITKGRHGQASNPAMRGLQLVNMGVRDMALSKGVTIKPAKGGCAGIAPTNGGWYSERLHIEKAPGSFPEEVIKNGVINLVKKIIKACTFPDLAPETLLQPDELQVFLESLCSKYAGNFDLIEKRRSTKP